MKYWHRIVGNAAIGGLITFFATLSLQYPPTMDNVWAGFIGAMLTLLPALQLLFKGNGGTENNIEPKIATNTEGTQPMLGFYM